jgi:hypothetical protein
VIRRCFIDWSAPVAARSSSWQNLVHKSFMPANILEVEEN